MDMYIDQTALKQNLDTMQMTTPPPPTEQSHKKRNMIITCAVIAILALGFAGYWFFLRDTEISEQEKLDILEQLKADSRFDLTPEAKQQVVSQMALENSAATNMSEEEKLRVLNSLGGEVNSSTNE